MGANDICHGGVSGMTSVTRFRSDFQSAIRILATDLPDARIQVLSIPDLYRLWQIEKGRFLARTAWRFLHTCDALLQRPQSNAPEDVARRALVRDRLVSFNDVLGDVCAEYVQCTYDGGAAFRTRFDRETCRRATSSTPHGTARSCSPASPGGRASRHPEAGDEESRRPVDVRERQQELGTARMAEFRKLVAERLGLEAQGVDHRLVLRRVDRANGVRDCPARLHALGSGAEKRQLKLGERLVRASARPAATRGCRARSRARRRARGRSR